MTISKFICPACENLIVEPALKAYQFCTSSKPVEFNALRVVTCDRCNFSFPDKQVSQESLDAYYHDDYSSLAKKRVSRKSDGTIGLSTYSYLPRSLSQIDLIKNYIDFSSRPRILEVGSGAGDFFQALQFLGYKTENYAIEPQEDAHSSLEALGVSVVQTTLKSDEEEENYPQNFDLVVMSHALEHFNGVDILPILERIKKYLRPQGLFFCEVPNANLKLFPNAPEIVVPHLSFFSEQAIRAFLERAALQITFLGTVGNSQFDNIYIGEKKSIERYGAPRYVLASNGRVLQNIEYLEQLEKHMSRKRRKQFVLNVMVNVFGKTIVKKLIDLRAIVRQPRVDRVFSSKYFQYGLDKEYMRVIARKIT